MKVEHSPETEISQKIRKQSSDRPTQTLIAKLTILNLNHKKQEKHHLILLQKT